MKLPPQFSEVFWHMLQFVLISTKLMYMCTFWILYIGYKVSDTLYQILLRCFLRSVLKVVFFFFILLNKSIYQREDVGTALTSK